MNARTIIFSTAGAVAMMTACGGSDQSDSQLGKVQSPYIYDANNRVEYYQNPNARAFALANATMAVSGQGFISCPASGADCDITNSSPIPDLCSSEQFYGQPANVVACSASLIGNRAVLTAAHCLPAGGLDPENYSFYFGFTKRSDGTIPLKVPAADVYKITQLVTWKYADGWGSDYAVVLLDRPVTNRQPLPMRRSGQVANGAPLMMAGYPLATPLKTVTSGSVRISSSNLFWHDVDSLPGNSGGPLINATTGEIEGLLTGLGNANDFGFVDGCKVERGCSGAQCDAGGLYAFAQTVVPAIAYCSDGIQDGDETDIDCGGSCPDCLGNKKCLKSTDCTTGNCLAGLCKLPQSCTTSADCSVGTCRFDGRCTVEFCSDGVKDYEETDVDCGGRCPPCNVNQICTTGKDCLVGSCSGGVCLDTGLCTTTSQCATGACISGHCATSYCGDGVQNYDETGLDCGGSCRPCNLPDLLSNVASISSGYNFACAQIWGTGQVKCWGRNISGELGNPSVSPQGTRTPTLVYNLNWATKISSAQYYTCARRYGDEVRCWGAWPDFSGGNSPTPVTLTSLAGAVDISTGRNICALMGDTTVKCTPSFTAAATTISGLTGVKAISSGPGHDCALLTNGTIKCWGNNDFGQLGDGTTTDASTPVTVSGITNATAISVGYNLTCALLQTGTVSCWGENTFGALGNGTNTDSSVPVSVSGLTNIVGIAAGSGDNSGGNAHACAISNTGVVKCWGYGDSGEMGTGNFWGSTTPVVASPLGASFQVTAGGTNSCVRTTTGNVACWGVSGYGLLGAAVPTWTNRASPVTILR